MMDTLYSIVLRPIYETYFMNGLGFCVIVVRDVLRAVSGLLGIVLTGVICYRSCWADRFITA